MAKWYERMIIYTGLSMYAYDYLYDWYYWDNPYPHIRSILWKDRLKSKYDIYMMYRNRTYLMMDTDRDYNRIVTPPDYWRNYDMHVKNFRENNLQGWICEHEDTWKYEAYHV